MSWWPRLLHLAAVGLLLFYVHYLPWHLAQDCHLPDNVALSAEVDPECGHELACCPHAEESQDTHHHDHVPHPASEHEVQMFSKSGKSLALDELLATPCEVLAIAPQICVFALPAETFLRPPSATSPAAHPRGPPVV